MIIELKNITKTYVGETILSDINLKINDNDRIGLIGNNGCGKTTLLNIITDNLSYDEGEIIYSGKKIGYLKQNPVFESSNTIISEMRSIFASLLNIEKKLNELYNDISLEKDEQNLKILNKNYADLQTEFEHKDGYNINVKINTVLNGMGFSDKDYNMPVKNMSGGEKTRLALAKLLLEEPDLLILDEPTNHLDFKTLKWLEDYLSSYKGAILMVSHDRYFLDKTVNQICEIYNTHLKSYKGNYSDFVKLKKEMVSFMTKEYEKQQCQIQSLKEYIARNKVRASTAKSAKSRENILNNLELIENPKEYLKTINLKFEYDYETSFELLNVESLKLEIGNNVLCENLSFIMNKGEKIAIVGENGIGKTTFLKALLNKISYQGKIHWGKNLRTTYYEQENNELNENNTVLSEVMDKSGADSAQSVRNILGGLLITNEDVFKNVSVLSGGEKAKVKFAIMMLKRGNTLIMDEPTNHLDLSSKEILDDALSEFNGNLIMVSHDRYLLNKVPTKIAELTKDGFVIYDGNYEDYINNKTEKKEKKFIKNVSEEKESFYKSKKYRSEQVKRQNAIKKSEEEIERLENEIQKLNELIASPEVSSSYETLTEKCNEIENLKNELEKQFEIWESLNIL